MLQPAMTSASVATPFGALDRATSAELTFPFGLPGFPTLASFLLSPIPNRDGHLYLLHGQGPEPVDLVVVPLEAMDAPIAPADVDIARQNLGIDAAALLVLLVVTLPGKGIGQAPMVNLRAPLFVDVERRIAVQTVLPQTHYPFRQPLAA